MQPSTPCPDSQVATCPIGHHDNIVLASLAQRNTCQPSATFLSHSFPNVPNNAIEFGPPNEVPEEHRVGERDVSRPPPAGSACQHNVAPASHAGQHCNVVPASQFKLVPLNVRFYKEPGEQACADNHAAHQPRGSCLCTLHGVGMGWQRVEHITKSTINVHIPTMEAVKGTATHASITANNL
eukprot:360203-Chlamydomonas_euryale.AAC.8